MSSNFHRPVWFSEKKHREEKTAAAEEEALRKRKAEEESKKSFEDKKKDLEEKISGLKIFIKNQNKSISAAIEKGLRLKDPLQNKNKMYTVQFCQKNIVQKTSEMEKLNLELMHHMGKRHKAVM